MNKKIKIIDLLNKIANKEELPQKILTNDEVWYLVEDKHGKFTYSQTKDDDWQQFIDYKLQITRSLNDEVLILDDEVEILEDNIEEIEELKYNVCGDVARVPNNEQLTKKINELVKRINYIERKINEN